MSRIGFSRAAVFIFAGLLSGAAHALPLTSNIGNNSISSGAIHSSSAPGVGAPAERANAFVTTGVASTLESVVLDIALRTLGIGTPGGFEVALHADNITPWTPGALLAVLAGPTDPGAGTMPTYTGSVALTANTTYWIVASIVSSAFDAQYSWSETTDLSEAGPGSIANSSFISTDNGVTWLDFTNPHIFAVNVDVIPEPGTALLCLSGLLGLAHIGRRGARR